MAINLRKPTEVFIAPGSITNEHLANGAVDASKIEDGAIDLNTAKVIGQLPETKLADNAVTETKIADGAVNDGKIANGAVIENKLADLAISTAKLQDNVVTLAKSNDDVKVTPFVGGEVEQSVEGITPEGIVETGFARVSGKYEPKKLRVIASLKVDAGSGNEASLKVYVDAEASARITLTSISDTYELVNGEADVSDLSIGRHKITIKIHSNTEGVKAYNDYVDVMFVK